MLDSGPRYSLTNSYLTFGVQFMRKWNLEDIQKFVEFNREAAARPVRNLRDSVDKDVNMF